MMPSKDQLQTDLLERADRAIAESERLDPDFETIGRPAP
jgi:hypothetical protein